MVFLKIPLIYFRREEEKLVQRHQQEKNELNKNHSDEEHRVLVEISSLEQELQKLLAPSQLLSSLLSPSRDSRSEWGTEVGLKLSFENI